MTDTSIQQAIRDRYGALARSGGRGDCCSPAAECRTDPITSGLYSEGEVRALPAEAVAASLGCGNPTAVVELEPGQVVLDLGSGGGIDVLLSARRVGPAGKVYGLDMTDEMLALARENQRRAGVANVEFLRGTIEAIPLPAASVDVIISNCVINLSTDKDAVLREAFRVLRPGGRFAVSDIVVWGDVPAELRRSLTAWTGCIAGALGDREYADKLRAAGFVDIQVEPWRIYGAEEARELLKNSGLDVEAVVAQVRDRFASAFIRARKPEATSCCAPECCASSRP